MSGALHIPEPSDADDGSAEQVCFVYRLTPGAGDEYDRLHAAIPDEIRQRIHDRGVQDYSIFRRGDLVISVLRRGPAQREPDPSSDAVQQRWSATLRPLFEQTTDTDGAPLSAHRVFRQD